MRHPWLPVARWETMRVLRRGDFIVSVLLTPLLAIGGGYLMQMMERGNRPAEVAVVRVEPGGVLAPVPPESLGTAVGLRFVTAPAAARDTTALLDAVRGRSIGGVILLPRDFAFGGRVDLLVRRDGARWPRAAGDWLRARARAERAAARGVSEEDLAAWDQAPEVRRVASIAAEAGRSGSVRAERIVVIAILLLGMTVVLSTISYLMIAISGEKQARVTEVVVSAIPAQAWMDGKIVAYTLIGLVMMAVWAGSLLAAAVPLAFAMPGSVNAALVAVTLALTVLGLYFYNAFFAALMASLQGMQSTSKFQGYFFLLPFVPLFFLVPVLESPDAAWVGVISQVPFFSSSLIPARMTSHAVQPWEVALAFAVLVASCWLMRLVAGRIFRLGMLLYGKDATLPELVRWAREA